MLDRRLRCWHNSQPKLSKGFPVGEEILREGRKLLMSLFWLASWLRRSTGHQPQHLTTLLTRRAAKCTRSGQYRAKRRRRWSCIDPIPCELDAVLLTIKRDSGRYVTQRDQYWNQLLMLVGSPHPRTCSVAHLSFCFTFVRTS